MDDYAFRAESWSFLECVRKWPVKDNGNREEEGGGNSNILTGPLLVPSNW